MSTKATADRLNGNAVKTAGDKASAVTRNAKQSVASTIEETILPNLGRIQALLLAGLALLQGLMQQNRKKTMKKMGNLQDTVASKAQKRWSATQDAAQSGLNTAQSALQSGLSTAQDVAQSGLSTAQDVLKKNVKRANKNLKKAQKSMKGVQQTVQGSVETGVSATQDVLQSGLNTAQDMLEKNVKSASKNLKKAGENMQDVQETVSRKTSRFLFRLGIVVGLVAILLYTPWPGSETRQKLADLFQQAKQNVSNLTSNS